MSQLGSSSHVPDEPCQVITVMKMDGSAFEIKGLGLSMLLVFDLKKVIARQEHIAEDMFELSVGDVVLKSLQLLKRSLTDVGILDTVTLTMTSQEPYCPDTHGNWCDICEMQNKYWLEQPVCQRCMLDQSDRLQTVFPWGPQS